MIIVSIKGAHRGRVLFNLDGASEGRRAACRRASAAAEESCRLIKKRAGMSKAVTWEQVAEHTTEEQKVCCCCLSHARLGGRGRESCALARVVLALSTCG